MTAVSEPGGCEAGGRVVGGGASSCCLEAAASGAEAPSVLYVHSPPEHTAGANHIEVVSHHTAVGFYHKYHWQPAGGGQILILFSFCTVNYGNARKRPLVESLPGVRTSL